MVNGLSLNLNQEKEVTIDKQAGNIISNISEAFSNAIKKGTEKITLLLLLAPW